ncbi:hypothetical protein C8J56DRAFT_915214 [Mycena floridula]|nr:hypothetical protein C8J56DRAFT_915214 [Mycena floridula]
MTRGTRTAGISQAPSSLKTSSLSQKLLALVDNQLCRRARGSERRIESSGAERFFPRSKSMASTGGSNYLIPYVPNGVPWILPCRETFLWVHTSSSSPSLLPHPMNVLFAANAGTTATAAMLTYDYFLTCGLEIEYIWSRPWSVSAVLFLINRYLPLVDVSLSLTLRFTPQTQDSCLRKIEAVTLIGLFAIVLCEVILMLRTSAMWSNRRSIVIIFSILTLVLVGNFIAVVILQKTIFTGIIQHFLHLPESPPCDVLSGVIVLSPWYIAVAASETIIGALMISKAVKDLPRSNSHWVAQLYREGIIFYLGIIVISLLNATVPFFAPQVAGSLSMLQRGAHSIICNRILLLIFRTQTALASPQMFTSALDVLGESEFTITEFELHSFHHEEG